MEKLVRDKMPEFCENGAHMGYTKMNYRIADPKEKLILLLDKLIEEAQEVKDAFKTDAYISNVPFELADVAEVSRAILAYVNLVPTDLERCRITKRSERGGFEKGIVWDGNK